MKSGPCQPHGLTTVRWCNLTFCQLHFGGCLESSRIPIYETWPVSLMGCQLWVQGWSHNKSWIQDIFSHLRSLHDLYAATATTFLMKITRKPPICPAEKRSLAENLVTDRRMPCYAQVQLRTEADFICFEIFAWDQLASRMYAATATPFHT